MASITCKVGGTAHTHTSVADVRACSLGTSGNAVEVIEAVTERFAPSQRAAAHSQRTGASARITETDVPEGRYALDGTGANTTVFYVVKWWDGRKGRMASVYLMVSDVETRVDFKLGLSVLRRIAEVGAHAASIRYGRELGVCGVCGRTLTSDASRAKGIGPICESRF